MLQSTAERETDNYVRVSGFSICGESVPCAIDQTFVEPPAGQDPFRVPLSIHKGLHCPETEVRMELTAVTMRVVTEPQS